MEDRVEGLGFRGLGSGRKDGGHGRHVYSMALPCLQHVYIMFTAWPCLGPARREAERGRDAERGPTQGEQPKGRSATAQMRMAGRTKASQDAQKHVSMSGRTKETLAGCPAILPQRQNAWVRVVERVP